MAKKNRIMYYHDEVNDDFVKTKTNIDTVLDENYQYLITSPVRKFFSFILYYFIAFPILFVEGKVFRGLKIKGKKNLRAVKKKGYIMYANHTDFRDAYLGHVFIANPKRTYIIANKDAVSIFFVRRLTKDLGALPVPDTLGGLKNLNSSVTQILGEKKALMIFPEAHIWPYYTKVRPFPVTSFRYAAINNVPCVPVAATYRKHKGLFFFRKKPQMVVYVGKPIFPNQDLSVKESAMKLRDETYEYICQMTEKYSTYEYYKYIKKE